MKKWLKNQKGLTLVELLAVIVILGIIAAIAVPAIGNIIENSRKDAQIANAEAMYDAARLAVVGENTSDDTTFHIVVDGAAAEESNTNVEYSLTERGYIDETFVEDNPHGAKYHEAYVNYKDGEYEIHLSTRNDDDNGEGEVIFNSSTENEEITIRDIRSTGRSGFDNGSLKFSKD